MHRCSGHLTQRLRWYFDDHSEDLNRHCEARCVSYLHGVTPAADAKEACEHILNDNTQKSPRISQMALPSSHCCTDTHISIFAQMDPCAPNTCAHRMRDSRVCTYAVSFAKELPMSGLSGLSSLWHVLRPCQVGIGQAEFCLPFTPPL